MRVVTVTFFFTATKGMLLVYDVFSKLLLYSSYGGNEEDPLFSGGDSDSSENIDSFLLKNQGDSYAQQAKSENPTALTPLGHINMMLKRKLCSE